MAELKKKEFAALCRTTEAVVTTNIARKKLVYDKKTKKLDTEDPKNKVFFNRYFKKAEQESKNRNNEIDQEELYKKVVETVEQKVDEKEKESRRRRSKKNVDWMERKQKADALLQERKAERELIQVEKLAGKLLPVDLSFNINRIHNQTIFATFHNDLENLASIYCDILAGGDRKKLAEVNNKLSERLDSLIKRAGEVAESSIETLIEEYQETRNRGEKK